MQQTLYAMLGMLVVTLVAFNQQRARIETRQAMINDELEVMASGIALQAMEYIGSQPFDESLKAEGVPASQPSRLALVGNRTGLLKAAQPTGRKCTVLPDLRNDPNYDLCDDLSDFNAMKPQTVPFPVGDHTFLFEVTAAVRYVDDQKKATAGVSRHKEVVVQVGEAKKEGGVRLLRAPVRLTRTFSIP